MSQAPRQRREGEKFILGRSDVDLTYPKMVSHRSLNSAFERNPTNELPPGTYQPSEPVLATNSRPKTRARPPPEVPAASPRPSPPEAPATDTVQSKTAAGQPRDRSLSLLVENSPIGRDRPLRKAAKLSQTPSSLQTSTDAPQTPAVQTVEPTPSTTTLEDPVPLAKNGGILKGPRTGASTATRYPAVERTKSVCSDLPRLDTRSTGGTHSARCSPSTRLRKFFWWATGLCVLIGLAITGPQLYRTIVPNQVAEKQATTVDCSHIRSYDGAFLTDNDKCRRRDKPWSYQDYLCVITRDVSELTDKVSNASAAHVPVLTGLNGGTCAQVYDLVQETATAIEQGSRIGRLFHESQCSSDRIDLSPASFAQLHIFDFAMQQISATARDTARSFLQEASVLTLEVSREIDSYAVVCWIVFRCTDPDKRARVSELKAKRKEVVELMEKMHDSLTGFEADLEHVRKCLEQQAR